MGKGVDHEVLSLVQGVGRAELEKKSVSKQAP